MFSDFDSTALIVIGLTALVAGLLVVMVSIKLAKMKVAKEIGYLKRRLRYRPRRPRKIYTINE